MNKLKNLLAYTLASLLVLSPTTTTTFAYHHEFSVNFQVILPVYNH